MAISPSSSENKSQPGKSENIYFNMFLKNKAQVEQACSILQEFNFSEPRSKHIILDSEGYKQNQKQEAKFTEKLLLTSPQESEEFVSSFFLHA